MGKLQNKTALITGAASGMGKAMALLFAKEGASVVVADLQKNEIDAVVNEIVQNGGKALGVMCDVSQENEVKNMIDSCMVAFKSLDVLVNNAGVMDDFMPLEKMDNDLWTHVMAINLNGPMYACRLAMPLMLAQKSGVIINVASVGGVLGCRAGLAYTASKHALIGLTKNIDFMYAQKGIRCNAIAPGAVNTNIGTHMHPDAFGMERAMIGAAAIPRVGEAQEIATTALFLASDEASSVNGSVLIADGGWSAY